MDDSFKNLNGPTADSIQSDYIAKEKRAAEELLNLQLGNAKKLADLRSKLLEKLNDEALEQGKVIEEYLAEYGLQQRLEALNNELKARQSAQTEQLEELHDIQSANSAKLQAAETKFAQQKAKRQDAESKAKLTQIDLQHKAELKAIHEAAKVRSKLQSEALTAVQAPDLNATINPELTEDISLESQSLAVEPILTDEISLPEAAVQIKPEVAPVAIEDQEAKLRLHPIVEELPEQQGDLSLTPKIDSLPDLNTEIEVTPIVSALPQQEADLHLVPKLESELEQLNTTLEVNAPENLPDVNIKAGVELPEALELKVKATPEIPPIFIEEQSTVLHLTPVIEPPVTDLEAKLKLQPIIEELPEQELSVQIKPIEDLAVEAKVTPVVEPIVVDEQSAALRLSPVIDPQVEDQTAKLNLVPILGEISTPELALKLKPEVEPIEEIEVKANLNLNTEALSGLQDISIASYDPADGVLAALDAEDVNKLRQQGLTAVLEDETTIIALRLEAEDNIAAARLSSLDKLNIREKELLAIISASNESSDGGGNKPPIKSGPSFTDDSGSEELVNPKGSRVDLDTEFKKIRIFLNDETNLRSSYNELWQEAEKESLNKIKTLAKNIRIQQLTTNEDLARQHRLAERMRELTAAQEIVKLQNQLREKNLVGTNQLEDELHKQHRQEVVKQHLESLIEISNKEIELKKLSLVTQAELEQQWEDEKADKILDTQTRLEKKKQELAKFSLQAQDEAYLRSEALAEQEEARLDYQMTLAERQADIYKAQIKYEQTLLAKRLKKEFSGEDEKYLENPDLLDQEIAAAQNNLSPKAQSQKLSEVNASIDAEQAATTATELAKAAASGETYDAEQIKANIQAQYDLKRDLAKKQLEDDAALEQKNLEALLKKKDKQNKIEEKSKKDAAKKAEKDEEKAHKKRLGQKAELADYGKGGAAAAALGTIFGAKDSEIEKLKAEGKEEEAGAMAQAKLDAAFETMGNFVNQLADKGKASADTQAAIDTRLQGASAKDTGSKVVLGSHWRGMAADIGVGLGMNAFFKSETVEASFEKLIGQGIAFNVKERAFLDTLKDKIATTFDVADGTLLKLVRIQQADTSAARLGMESALTSFLNSMYATTEYMQEAAKSIRANLYEATALMGAEEATEFEFQVQKWMGSLYSVGFSNTEGISAALGKITAGDIGGITEGSMGNLLVMAANEASIPIAEILEKGLTAEKTDDLMKSMVEYLAKLYEETKGSNVLAQQFAGVYGVTAADLKAAANLAPSIKAIEKNDQTYNNMLKQVDNMSKTMILRTSMGEMMENMKQNFTYSMATSLANNPVLSLLNTSANMLNDLVGGIEIPFVNVYGFGFDLNATVADLMNVAALSGSVLGGVGKMVAGLGNALNPSSMLRSFGIDQGKLDVQTRGTGAGNLATMASGATTSESGFVGNESGDDVKEKTVQDASAGPEKQVAEAKEEQEDKEESRAQMMAGHIVDIYELLQDVVAGSKKFHVQLDVGNNPISWAGGTWN